MVSAEPLVLVIEDDRQIRRFLKASLATQAYRLVETDKGREGLKAAKVCRWQRPTCPMWLSWISGFPTWMGPR
jgi:hypothetical protein